MRRSAVVLGLTVTAGAVITVGSGWRAGHSSEPMAMVDRQNTAQSRMGASANAGYAASQWADRNSAGTAIVSERARHADAERRETEAEVAGRAALPWLRNFAATGVSTTATPRVVERMAEWRALDESCSVAAYGGLSITADIGGGRGEEEVLASFTQGVLVVDAAGKLLASATGLECQGSADDVVAIAAGDAHIDGPVIALAVTTGGHRASTTWLVLYRVIGGVVAPVFSGAVEDHVEGRTRSGEVTLLPGALEYRAPSGKRTLWTYSAERGRYDELALEVPPGV
jgi:hypothetical protein